MLVIITHSHHTIYFGKPLHTGLYTNATLSCAKLDLYKLVVALREILQLHFGIQLFGQSGSDSYSIYVTHPGTSKTATHSHSLLAPTILCTASKYAVHMTSVHL